MKQITKDIKILIKKINTFEKDYNSKEKNTQKFIKKLEYLQKVRLSVHNQILKKQ